MTEDNSNISLDKDTKKVRVLLDPSPIVAAKDLEIAELNRTVGALLHEHKKEYVEGEQKPANTNGESATLEPLETFKIPYDEENQILDMNPKFANEKECIDYIKNCASNPQSGDYQLAQKLYGKMVKKTLNQGGTWEFKGNMARWERRGDKVVKANRPQTFEKVKDED